MCGINGAISFNSSKFEITEPYISGMRDTMEHRGPDGAGVWVSENKKVGFGHRRLAIIDLSTSAIQPMSNEDGSIWVTFNGEIYNHADIRKELEALGKYKWKTNHSDTEVIVHAFAEWGIDCIHKFRGMFAIGIWDDKKKEMWLVRDRIGIKPLYYSIHDGRLVFASEIKALLKDPDQKRAVHEEAFYHYLSFLTTPAPQTLFDGILKLPAGTWLKVTLDGKVEEKKYWDVWDYTKPMTNKSEEEITQTIISELRESVKLRKVSDVPVGIFLSGGIDSSTNVALFSEGETSNVKTFSIGYDRDYGTYKNELHFAKSVADKFNAQYFEQRLTVDDLLGFLPNMIHLQDEPIADPVCVPVYFVSKLARDNGVIVCQVGEGSDELFWGYPTWKLKLRLQQANAWPVPKVFKKAGLSVLRMMGKKDSWPYAALQRVVEDKPVFWGGAESFTEEQKKRLLSPRLKKKFANYSSFEGIRPIWDRFHAKAWEKSDLNWMTYLDLNLRLPELLLMRVDKMSMGVSLEGRVPFLDYKFVEMAMSIPSKVKTKNGDLKYILKKAVRGLIPDEIIDRPKQGFGVPVYEWLFDKLGDEIRTELRSFARRTDFFEPDVIEEHISKSSGAQLWYLYNFALWHKTYIEMK
ncbi:asparagine synthase (glutamine-hydrolyzing) [Bdellovibrio sp. HCB117]|uniref:asparagine synthase (glutamine-hydrolyzing) n=1 Tax=Bdellovibrio sp. HCB117 TaxID=3394359 RepID=UPI0039B4F4C7